MSNCTIGKDKSTGVRGAFRDMYQQKIVLNVVLSLVPSFQTVDNAIIHPFAMLATQAITRPTGAVSRINVKFNIAFNAAKKAPVLNLSQAITCWPQCLLPKSASCPTASSASPAPPFATPATRDTKLILGLMFVQGYLNSQLAGTVRQI